MCQGETSKRTGDRAIRIAIDLSVLTTQPLTGVGVHSLNLMQALLKRSDRPEFALFATGARPNCAFLEQLLHDTRLLRWPTRLKIPAWTRFNWPPAERITGPVDIAHGAFHLLPPAHRAKRTAMIFDVAWRAVQDIHPRRTADQADRIVSHAVRNANSLLAMSESTKQDLVRFFGADPEKIHIVHGGINTNERIFPPDEHVLAAARRRLSISERYFIHLGSIEPRKNLVRLLEAYARVRQTRTDSCPQLVLAGPLGWMYDPVLSSIRRLSLQSSVIHTGYVSHEDAQTLLKGAHACVYPSLYEGFGLPALEAMAAGVPLLTSNVSALPEVVGDTALMVDPLSVDDIERGLQMLIDHYGICAANIQPARTRALSFTWDNSAQMFLDAMDRIHARS